MYGWRVGMKKTECRRTDAFEVRCWRRLLRVPWTTRRSNQSILKKISPEYSLEGLMWNWSSNILTIWYEELTHWKRPWCWERLKAGGEGEDRGWDGWMASSTQWTRLSRLWETVKGREAWSAAVHKVEKGWTQLSDWTTMLCYSRPGLDFPFVLGLVPFPRAHSLIPKYHFSLVYTYYLSCLVMSFHSGWTGISISLRCVISLFLCSSHSWSHILLCMT